MEYLNHIFFGFFFGSVGLISPGMLNMTALKIRMDIGKIESIKFSLGASIIVLFQALIALLFVDFFVKRPEIIDFLKRTAVFVLFVLAIIFYGLSRRKVKLKSPSKKLFFVKGLAMSSINMLAIPYYLAISIYLAADQKLILDRPFNILFTFGASIGSFFLFYGYIYFAKIIASRVIFIVKHINIILSLLFVVLGILVLIETLP